MSSPLIAIVTGASRGVGKGIALALGAAGATVYVTGRSRRVGAPGAPLAIDPGLTAALPGTIDDTADEVTARGGRGVAVACDHGDDAQVEALFAKVDAECGRLDVLVNNVFAIPEGQLYDTPFWQLPLSAWDTMIDVGLRSHYVASVLAARRMSAAGHGLIANISSFGGGSYQVNVPYGVGKGALDRLSRDSARDLQRFGVTVVSLWPGIVRTERVLAGQFPYDTSNTESPELTGRAILALLDDPKRHERSGRAWVVAELAAEYGFVDTDGSSPRSLRRPPATTAASTEPHPLLARAREVGAELRAHRAIHDRDRQLAPAVVAALREHGFLSCLVPRLLGGAELAMAEYVELLEVLATGDAAAAWCVMTASTSAMLATYLPRATAEAMWRAQPPFLAGIFAPGGKLTGYPRRRAGSSDDEPSALRLSGRWSYASGSRHADWFAVGAMHERRHVVCFVPAADVTVVDNWDTLGLAGTGSHDLELTDVAISADHVTSLFDRGPWATGTLYRVPVFGLLAAGISACGLGIATAALQHVAASLTAESSSAMLTRWGQARAQLDAARSYLRDTVASAQASTHAAEAATRGRLRLASSYVAQQCAEVTRVAFHLGGGASARAGSPLGSALRDVETMLTHRMVVERVVPAAARAVLGLGTPPPDL
jgi:dehydrogenase/reductase SDR family member 1